MNRYPKKESWKTFESLICDLYMNVYNTVFTKNGRQGQKQNGVDIFGAVKPNSCIAVQCKNTIKELSTSIIDSEIKKAKLSPVKFNQLIIVTSADSDSSLLAHVMNLNNSKNSFTVSIVFWEGIEMYLNSFPLLVGKYYPQFIKKKDCDLDQWVQKISNTIEYIRVNDPTAQITSYSDVDIIEQFESNYGTPNQLSSNVLISGLQRNLVNQISKYYSLLLPPNFDDLNGRGIKFNIMLDNLHEVRKEIVNTRKEICNLYSNICQFR